MGASKTQIMNYLEMRFDYQSARNVMYNWRKTAGIKDELESLDDNHLKCLLSYLKANAADATRVHAAIERLILSDCDGCVEAPAVVEEAVVEAPVVEEAVVEAPVVEEAVVDAPMEVVDAPMEEAVVEATEESCDAPAGEEAGEAATEEAPAPKKSKKKSKH